MKTTKESLIDNLKIILDTIRNSSRDIQKINETLREHHVTTGTLAEVLADEFKLETLDLAVLCLLTLAIDECTNQIKIDDYFNEREISKAKLYEGEEKVTIEYPIIFENVEQVDRFEWVTAMLIKDINNLNNSGVLDYNYETQRSAKYSSRKDGSIIQRPDVNKESVKQIAQLMVNKKYKSDTITFNVLMDGEDDVQYDEKERQLIINSGRMDILDGFHRIKGLGLALEQEPNLELKLIVSIKNYKLDEAKFYFGQINSINVVSASRVKQLRNERISDMITTELEKKSKLRGKISSSTGIAHSAGHITNFAILSDAIEEIFKPESKKDYIDLSAYLIDFFDYFLESFENEFEKNVAETKNRSWINHHNLFVGYIVLAKKFYDYGIPLRKIVDVMNEINFSKETSPLNAILKGQGKENSNKIKKQIREFFESIQIPIGGAVNHG